MRNTNEDIADAEVAEDFERGWSEERLDAAEFHWGPGKTEVAPEALSVHNGETEP